MKSNERVSYDLQLKILKGRCENNHAGLLGSFKTMWKLPAFFPHKKAFKNTYDTNCKITNIRIRPIFQLFYVFLGKS